MISRNERYSESKRRYQRNRKRLLLIILTLFGLMVVLQYTVSYQSGSTILSWMKNTGFLQVMSRWLPADMEFHYGEAVIANQPFVSKDSRQSAGTATLTDSSDAAIEIMFRGNGIEWFGFKGDYSAKADIFVDHVLAGSLDLYSPQYLLNQQLFSTTNLPSGTHILTIKTASKHPDAKGNLIGIDYFRIIDGSQVELVEDQDPRIKYINGNHDYYLQFLSRKIAHMLVYFFITACLFWLLVFAGRNNKMYLVPVLMLIIACLDEGIQSFRTERHASYLDIGVDMIGVVFSFAICMLLRFVFLQSKRK